MNADETPEELGPPKGNLDDTLNFLLSDPQILDGLLAEFCRLWLEDGQEIIEPFKSLVARRFCDHVEHATNAARSKRSKDTTKRRWGAQAIGRTMGMWIDVFKWLPTLAAEMIGKAAGIDPESAMREYRRWLKTRKNSAKK